MVIGNRRGVALALVLAALVAVGALAAAALFAAMQEHRMGTNTRRVQQALAVAEARAHEALAARLSYPIESQYVTVLNPDLYLIQATGADREALGRAQVGLLARSRMPVLGGRAAGAALMTPGPLRVGAAVVISGDTAVPPGWGGCDGLPDTAVAGLRTSDSSGIDNPALTDSAFADMFARWDAELSPALGVSLSGGVYATWPTTVAGGACDRSDPFNWGDGVNPRSPCADYLPVIRSAGDVTLTAGHGQGILLVDGDLHVDGSYRFFGVVMVRGALRATGGPIEFWGSVITANQRHAEQRLAGAVAVRYSKCAIVKALRSSGAPLPLRSRGWSQLF